MLSLKQGKIMWNGRTLYNDKVFNSSRKYNDQITHYIKEINI